jgi:hypothetical protein
MVTVTDVSLTIVKMVPWRAVVLLLDVPQPAIKQASTSPSAR